MSCSSDVAVQCKAKDPVDPSRVLVHTLHEVGSTSWHVTATTLEPTAKMWLMVCFPDALTGDETACHATSLTEAYICSGE